MCFHRNLNSKKSLTVPNYLKWQFPQHNYDKSNIITIITPNVINWKGMHIKIKFTKSVRNAHTTDVTTYDQTKYDFKS